MRRMREFAGNAHADPQFWKPARLIAQLADRGGSFEDPAPVRRPGPASKTKARPRVKARRQRTRKEKRRG